MNFFKFSWESYLITLMHAALILALLIACGRKESDSELHNDVNVTGQENADVQVTQNNGESTVTVNGETTVTQGDVNVGGGGGENPQNNENLNNNDNNNGEPTVNVSNNSGSVTVNGQDYPTNDNNNNENNNNENFNNGNQGGGGGGACAGVNRDARTCGEMGIGYGGNSCINGATWRCQNNCAVYVSAGYNGGSNNNNNNPS